MRRYTLAELASPQGAREFIDECEKRENSIVQDIVDNLKRAVQQGTDWSDGELCDIVQKEIEDMLQERAMLIEALQGCVEWMEEQMDEAQKMDHMLEGHDPDDCCLCAARAALDRVEGGKG